MDDQAPSCTMDGSCRNIFGIESILQQHLQCLCDEIQQLITAEESQWPPVLLPEPLQWNQYLLDQDLDEWDRVGEGARDDIGRHQDGPTKLSTHGFPSPEKLDESGQSSPAYISCGSPPDFLKPPGPQTSTPISSKPVPIRDPLAHHDKVLPIEYMGPKYLPALKHDEPSNIESPAYPPSGLSPAEGRVHGSSDELLPSGPVQPPRQEFDIDEFREEYEGVKRRLENRRRAEREALARLTSSESSSHPCRTSVEKLRSSIDNLSMIIDEMVDLLNIDIAEASASEVQERAEALWGREVAAQLSEEYSRDIEASKSEKSKHKIATESKELHTDREFSKKSKSYLSAKAAKESAVHKSSFPLLGPRDIGYERGSTKRLKGKAKTERRGDTLKRMSPSSSPRMRTSPVHPARTSPMLRTTSGEGLKADPKALFQSSAPHADYVERSNEGDKGTNSVASPQWQIDSEMREAMEQQRLWRFEESAEEDAVDKEKQRRAEICRTTIGSLPPLQKVASATLVRGPKKKARKMCTLKIVAIVTPVLEQSASSTTDLQAPAGEVTPDPEAALRSERRWEAGFF